MLRNSQIWIPLFWDVMPCSFVSTNILAKPNASIFETQVKYSTLKMETIHSTETLLSICQITMHHSP